MQTQIKIKLVHSPCGRYPKQRETVRGLGFSRLYQERLVDDTPAIRGMVEKIPHLVKIVEENIRKQEA